MRSTDIAIVGGGLAGLSAARVLQAHGADFVLLEARERLGGRILTVDERGTPAVDGFDLGPSWFWPRLQPAIGDLVKDLGLQAFAQNSEGDVIFERMSREPAQRYRGGAPDVPSMRLVGGSAALIGALEGLLPANRVFRGSRVMAMRLADDAVELSVSGPSGTAANLQANRVIAALPPRLLDATVTFAPPQDVSTTARWRDAATWMAPHAKFFAVYDRPFWREAGLSGTAQSMVGPMPEIHDATIASGATALFGFIGVPAEQRAAVGDEALKSACLAQFARIFGEEAIKPRATLLKDWAADPLTATSADQVAGSHEVSSERPWVEGAWSQRLVMAGSETSCSEAGYLAGAVLAGHRAADAVVGAKP